MESDPLLQERNWNNCEYDIGYDDCARVGVLRRFDGDRTEDELAQYFNAGPLMPTT